MSGPLVCLEVEIAYEIRSLIGGIPPGIASEFIL